MKKNLNDIILIPTDFSEVCTNAVEHGLVLAKSMNYRVFLLHVINKDTKQYLEDEKLTREVIVERLDKLASDYSEEYGVQVEYLIKSGNFFKKIAKISEKLSVKLIILFVETIHGHAVLIIIMLT